MKISKKYVSKELAQEIHAKASPFIKWLKEAEEESEESDDEEGEDVEVELFSQFIREIVYFDRLPVFVFSFPVEYTFHLTEIYYCTHGLMMRNLDSPTEIK